MVVQHAWRLFTREEDMMLLSLHDELGNRWSRIAERTEDRDKNAIRTRIQSLRQSAINAGNRERGMFPFRLGEDFWFSGAEPPLFEDFVELINPWA